jgi:hypothetical protein
MFVTFPSLILELHALLPLKVLQARERALTPYFSAVFILDSHLSPLRSLGVHHYHPIKNCSLHFLVSPIVTQT